MLNAAVHTRLAPGPTNALMLSAGWDSRLLLSALREADAISWVRAYSHGDQESREMRIIAGLADRTGVRLRREAQREDLYDLDSLRDWNERTETILFPHWHLAGRNLRDDGVGSVFSGVYGEIMGGHYGPAMLVSGREKVASVLSSLSGRAPAAQVGAAAGRRAIERFVERKLAGLPRSFSEGFRGAIAAQAPTLRQDLAVDLDRLERRGVTAGDQLVEAFVAEHRGTQYINAQMLSMRAYVDVAMPFTDRALLALTSRLPLPDKIQNAMHRRLLRLHGRDLLRDGTAATALPADAPIVFQEFARAWRWTWETAAWKTYWRTRGRIGPPRVGWCNYEFLRRSPALVRVVDDLRDDLWDRDALRRRLDDSASFRDHRLVYPDAFLRLYGVDLTLRRTQT
jgi:asparagine synthetase B (glutamine-hydrolysing)